jgi:hypothetical protein
MFYTLKVGIKQNDLFARSFLIQRIHAPFSTVSTRFTAVFDPFLARFFTVSHRIFSPSLREEILRKTVSEVASGKYRSMT